jgi:dienelactone hydrolase
MSGTVVLEQPVVLVDDPVKFTVRGCEPGELITVSATWNIGDETVRTEGHFVASAEGLVDPAHDESVGGTYVGVEPHGLWWSLEHQDPFEESDVLVPWNVLITATAGEWESRARLTRAKIDAKVRQVPVHVGRLRGVAFLPDRAGPVPSVVVFSGSGGGLGGVGGVQSTAALLASHGFAALALAYFRYEDLPADLVEIPLEYFAEAIEWLKAQVTVLGDRVAVMGASRGGELALLLGTVYPDDVAAVVAKVPSGVIWGGIGSEPTSNAPAWTFEGRPIAPLSSEGPERDDLPLRDGAIALTPSFEARIASASPDDLADATIPIERSGGPVLLLSGEDDAMWPSVALSEIVVERGAAKNALQEIRHLRYSDAGHTFTTPAGFPIARAAVHPLSGQYYAYGGTLSGNAHASADSWREILEFLTNQLVNALTSTAQTNNK